MYLVDFIKRMTRKSNIPVLIYLVLNIFVIAGIVSFLFGGGTMPFCQALLIGIVLYAISLVIALSPIGEWILRLQTGCKKIKRVEQINFIEPIFREVYDKAKKLDSSIPDDVQLYMNTDEDPNAFATGRKTICVTEGMLHMPESQIKATLGHEFGHLAHKDTDLILVVSVGNLIVSAFILGIRLVIDFYHLIFGLGKVYHMGNTEDSIVRLDLNSFTSHCFITGSTGSGKSNTTYGLLEKFIQNDIPFLVVEPAKGEYKEAFGAVEGINIFTTNPLIGQMLKRCRLYQ